VRLLAMFLLVAMSPALEAGVLRGKVYDLESGRPLPGATIRVLGTGRAMLANDQGQYRLRLDAGSYRLKFSHVAHYSEIREVNVSDSDVVLDVAMRPAVIEISGTKVYSRAYDPAQRIIVEAIARKKEILSRLHSYDFDAYTRLLVRDTAKADSESVVLITETQMKGYWEQPDKYKETITARKQSSNIEAEGNLVTIGEILNFNADRLDIDRYSVVSPTATDALDYYDYYLLDTIFIDDKMVFRLELEPKNNVDPLFVGTIDIADSSFEVVGVDGTFSEGFETPFLSNIRYRQRCAQFDNEYWMPIEIAFSVVIDLPIPGLSVYSVDYLAALHNYSFEVKHKSGTFDYVIEVDPKADDVDSAEWYSGQMVPLTELELRGYERIDSLEHAPRSLGQRFKSGLGWLVFHTAFDSRFFHFNRVEGAYLGYGGFLGSLLPRTSLDYRIGYAFDRERWQHRYGLTTRLWRQRQVEVRLAYEDDIVAAPTIISSSYNPTIMALANKTDPLDYYRRRGVDMEISGKIVNKVRLSVGYGDHRQYAEHNHTEYSLFRESKRQRPNPTIVEGTMRSGSVGVSYDSRPLIKMKNVEFPADELTMSRIDAVLEVASPDLVDNDFEFVRYYLNLTRRQRTLGMGVTTLRLFAGASDRSLPPQRYFTVDFGDEFFGTSMDFKTTGETNFKGSRAACAYAQHDFGRWLYRRTGLPVLRDFPFPLSLHGGVFWTDFEGHPRQPGDELLHTAQKTYSEIGFGLGRIPPLSFRLFFTWQLSDYDTSRFTFSLGSIF